ncbi:MAG: glycosyltransferase family 4 protein [Alkalispirochaeta sp.]
MAFLINVLLTPFILRLAHRFEWYDHINDRKIHTESTPRLGGVGIFVSFVAAAVAGLTVIVGAPGIAPWSMRSVALILGGLALVHGLGLYDDFVNLRAPLKFAVQLAAGALVALSGALLRVIDLPWIGSVELPPWFAFALTILWVVSISNAVNLIDGADGLAGGVALIAALFMGIIALGQGSLVSAVLAFAVVGSLAGFLIFNLPPARIFMGDSGSLSLGYILAVLPLLGFQRGEPGFMAIAPFPVLTLLYIPIVDTLLAIFRRLGRGLPVHSADREHIHHRLIDRGVSGRRLLSVIYGMMVIFGFVATAWYQMAHGAAALLTLVVWITTLIIIVILDNHDRPAA